MEDIQEAIDRICTLLEDAVEERDWQLVETCVEELNQLYEDLDRKSEYINDY